MSEELEGFVFKKEWFKYYKKSKLERIKDLEKSFTNFEMKLK